MLSLATGKQLNLFADADTAPVMTAHGTEIRVHIQIFVVIRASSAVMSAMYCG